LKGRLSLETINEKPPGETPNHLKPNYDVESFNRLTVSCDNGKKVKVDYLEYLSFTTFKKTHDIWYLCHTWTRTWGEGSKSGLGFGNSALFPSNLMEKERNFQTYKSGSTFINLSTGERHDVNSLSFWRGTLHISSDGNMILVKAGIMASSALKVIVYDISSLPNVETIYYEEIWENVNCSVSFNENNEFICTYFHVDDSYENPTKEITVVRKRDIMRTVTHDQESEYPTTRDEALHTYLGVNKMIEIERLENRSLSLKSEILEILNNGDFSSEKYDRILGILKT
jgi:hypothetical protein